MLKIFKCDHRPLRKLLNTELFAVVLFIKLYKVVLTLESGDEILGVTVQMKATKKFFSVVLFIN